MSESDTAGQIARPRGPDLERVARRLRARWRFESLSLGMLAPLVERLERRPQPGVRFRRVPPGKPARGLPLPVADPAFVTDLAPTDPNEPPTHREGSGEPLGRDVQQRLRAVLGWDPREVRVFDDHEADSFARSHSADAVTVGREVFFRSGKFQPREPDGLALLAHEAVHAGETMQGDVSHRRSTAAGAEQEEREALRMENRVLRGPGHPQRGPVRLIPPVVRPRPAASHGDESGIVPAGGMRSPAMRPMRAASDREEPEAAGATAVPNLEEFRRTIYRDLLTQIRSEFERGG